MNLNLSGKIAVIVWAAASFGMISCMTASAAGPVIGIDAAGWSEEDWGSIAMTNDETVSTGVVIRSEASRDSKAAGYLYRGAAAEVIFRGEKWTEIRSGNVKGFVKNRFLVYGEDARAYAEQYGSAGVSANWDDVNVFADADADAPITRTLTEGSTMPLLADGGHWLAVRAGKEGTEYVSSEDVTKLLLLETAVPVEEAGSPEQAAEEIYIAEDAGQAAEAVYSAAEEAGVSAGNTDAWTEQPAEETGSSYSAAEYSSADTAQEETYEEEQAAVYEEAAPSSDVSGYAAAKVSEDADVQALYDYYVEMQEAAMHPENEEDAQAKADAASAAYEAYLAAANRMQSWVSDVSSGADTESTGSYDSGESYEVSLDDSDEEYDSKGQKSSDPDPSNDYTNYSDLDLIAALIWCEAGNQPYDGMVAVGSVVMNRVASSSFPNTVAGVLNQPGQFYPASSGTLQKTIEAGINDTCYSAARDAMNGVQPVPGALYFNTSSGTTKLGDHYFS